MKNSLICALGTFRDHWCPLVYLGSMAFRIKIMKKHYYQNEKLLIPGAKCVVLMIIIQYNFGRKYCFQ